MMTRIQRPDPRRRLAGPLRITTLQTWAGQATPHRGQEPAPLRRQHRHIQTVRGQAPQEPQLGDLGLHRRRLHRAGRQPPQPRHPDRRVGDQQPVQLRAPLGRELVRQPIVGFLLRLLTGVRDPLHHRHRARPDHSRRDQVLARQPEQQGRRIVLHCPRQQELAEFLQLQPTGGPPAEVLRHQPQMLGACLRTPAVRTDLGRFDFQLLGQPSHRHRRRRGHPGRHEPQPRQRAQRHRHAQPIRRTTTPDPDRRTRCQPEST